MLEIVFLIFYTLKIGKIVESKGYERGPYMLLVIGFWIVFELLGAYIGSIFFEEKRLAIYLLALFGAGISVIITYSHIISLEPKGITNKPDKEK